MKLTVKENRELIMINARNTQNENDVETLQISVPEKYEDFYKKIVFITDEGVVWDLIENDTYTIKRAITKYDSVKFYIWLTKDEQDFRSVEKTLYFNKNHEVDGEVTPEEQTQMEQVISILESEIDKVENINIDVSKEENVTTVTITDKDGNEKTVTILDGQNGTNGQPGKDGTDGKNGKDGADGQDGIDGQDGADGVGISSIVFNNDNTMTITLTNGNTYTSQSLKGNKGDTGEQGVPGQPGANGKDGKDGTNGTNGVDGQDGQDGYTPTRGTDYWTNQDIAAIESYCDNYIDANITQVLGGSY